MKNLLLTVLAFGLLSSSALAEKPPPGLNDLSTHLPFPNSYRREERGHPVARLPHREPTHHQVGHVVVGFLPGGEPQRVAALLAARVGNHFCFVAHIRISLIEWSWRENLSHIPVRS